MKRPLTAEIAFAQQLWEEEQRSRAEELRRLKELEEQERRRLLKEEQEKLKLNQEIPYNQKSPGYSSPIIPKKSKKKVFSSNFIHKQNKNRHYKIFLLLLKGILVLY